MTKIFLLSIIILLPLQFALNIGDNFDLVTTRVLIPLLFLFWLVRGLARKKIEIPNRAETWLIVIFIFLSAFSLFLGREMELGLRKILYLFSIFPVFFVAADIFQSEKWSRLGAVAIIISGAVAAGMALVQFFLPFFLGIGKAVKIWKSLAPYFLGRSFGSLVVGNSSWLVNIGGITRMRAFGFFPDPHNFAFFLNLCFFVTLGYIFRQKNAGYKLGFTALAGLMLLASGLSFSRGGYLGLIAGVFFFGVIFLKRSGILGKVAVALAMLLIVFSALNINIITRRLTSSFNLKEGSNAERYKNWVEAVDVIQDYPLGGVGLGNYARTIDPISKERSSIYAHNLFLDIAAETGILNALVFLSLLAFSIWRNFKNGGMLNLGIAAGLVCFLIHSIFDTALYSPQVLTLLLTIIALGLFPINPKNKIENGKDTA